VIIININGFNYYLEFVKLFWKIYTLRNNRSGHSRYDEDAISKGLLLFIVLFLTFRSIREDYSSPRLLSGFRKTDL